MPSARLRQIFRQGPAALSAVEGDGKPGGSGLFFALSRGHEASMSAPKDVAGAAKTRGTKVADKREISRQVAEIIRLNEDQQGIFAALLADMDSRIDEIAARTDRLLAQYF